MWAKGRRRFPLALVLLLLPGLLGSLALGLTIFEICQRLGVQPSYSPVPLVVGMVLFLLPRALVMLSMLRRNEQQAGVFLAESLAKLDPPHADEYRQRATAYRAELTRLDEYARRSIASIPPAQRVLVTAHDAFGYFSHAYEIDVKSVQGVSTEAEAGVSDVNALVDFLVGRKLPAIFVESSVNAKNIQAVIEGAASRGVTVRVGGELFSDAMGAEGTYEGTYLGMIDHNVTTITRALGGDAPEQGMDGKLGAK